ncbi:hypothetical protein DF286_01875 [Sphingosinicella humi]|uniref:Uncharacterized protein n=2 Tax=Allosphingosinicella humi TaxID=2068657 RepID=A0A2U2J090_9SPHN|nr:hypothetical protein DF286_01875 [Sphingosinicella humi]
MRRCEVDRLDPTRTYWVPAVVSPAPNWAGAPGCRRGARFMVDTKSLRVSRDEFSPFDSRLSCLNWIMLHRPNLNRTLPGARIQAVALDRWLLGLD